MGTRISQNTASSLAFSCASLNFNSCTLLTTSLLVFQFHTYLSVTLWFSLLNHLEIKVTSFILYLTSLCRIFYRLSRVFTLPVGKMSCWKNVPLKKRCPYQNSEKIQLAPGGPSFRI